MRVRVVVNPTAGGGAAGRRATKVTVAMRRAGLSPEVVSTRYRGHAAELAREAVQEGVDCIAVVGGDGTVSETCQAYLESHQVRRTRLAVIPSGTGCDLARTLGLSHHVDQAVANICNGSIRPLDLGVLEITRAAGGSVVRAFLNMASFGLSGLTDLLASQGPKWMGGRAAYLLGALRALSRHRNIHVAIRVDGRDCLEAPIMNVAIANGRYFGGGMLIAPEADPSDGLFDIVAVHDLSRVQGLALVPKIYQGTHPGSSGVRVARGSSVEVELSDARDRVLVDADGETPGWLPLKARVLPRALELCVP